MLLLLFDIDGTLTDTNDADDRFFRQAIQHVLSGHMPEMGSWDTFKDVTDSAITRSILTRVLGRPARDTELMAVRNRFIDLWAQEIQSGRISINPIPGAVDLFAEIQEKEDVYVAVATGGWGPTAALKLSFGGFPVDELVIASSDDSETRTGILNTAAIHAAAARGIPGFSDVVVIGDAIWDVRAARDTGAGVVVRCTEPDTAATLRMEGAAAVLSDFADTAKFWSAVEAARKGNRPGGEN